MKPNIKKLKERVAKEMFTPSSSPVEEPFTITHLEMQNLCNALELAIDALKICMEAEATICCGYTSCEAINRIKELVEIK
jgi:hypothetical protein